MSTNGETSETKVGRMASHCKCLYLSYLPSICVGFGMNVEPQNLCFIIDLFGLCCEVREPSYRPERFCPFFETTSIRRTTACALLEI